MKKEWAFFLDMVLISVISLVQSFSLITFNGVKPNFVLAVLVVLIFLERSFVRYLILVLTSLIFLKYSIFISKEIFIFGALMLLAFYFKKYLSENIFLYSFLLTSVLTALLYLLADARFILDNFNLFSFELFYNILASLAFGYLYSNLYHGKE